MTKQFEVYKCEECGIVVEVLEGGAGTLVCCDEPMKLMEEQTADQTTEKHVPVVERVDEGIKVTVGSTLHPMTEKHWIQWIQLMADGKVYKQYLKPEDDPVAVFPVKADKVSAREYCNIHGLWRFDE
jgi:superoxide reductase